MGGSLRNSHRLKRCSQSLAGNARCRREVIAQVCTDSERHAAGSLPPHCCRCVEVCFSELRAADRTPPHHNTAILEGRFG